MHFKVITAVTTEPVSLAEARLQLRLTEDDQTAENPLVSAWITAAREIAEHYTRRAVAAQTLEAAMDCFPDCGEGFDLPMPPVASVTSVKYTDTDGVEQTLSTSAYALSTYGESRRVALTYGNSWPSTRDIPDAVRVRFMAGYTTCPKAVKQAILMMVAWMDQNRGDEMVGDDIQPPAAKALLNTVKGYGF